MKLRHFTLRDLFWLVLVAAIGSGWWIERRQQEERIIKLKTKLRVMEIERRIPIYCYPGDKSHNVRPAE